MSSNIIGKGTTGPQGSDGDQGPIGPQGLTGDQGEQGYQGVAGTDGNDGNDGAKGDQGDTGAKGDQGDTGAAGSQGDTGAKGDQGDTGVKGDQGETGAQGSQGADGDRSSTGSSIPATNIDWSTDDTFYKSISANTTFTFSNTVNGNVISICVTADGSDRTLTWPSGIKWPEGTIITTVTASTSSIYTFIKINSIVFATAVVELS